MCKFLITSLVVFLCFFSSTSFAEWEYIGKTKKGYDLYFDNKSLEKLFGHIYFFALYDFDKVNNFGTKSVIAYYKLSCYTLKYKSINDKMFKEKMGKGIPRENSKPYENWRRSNHKDFAIIMKEFCSYSF